MTPATQHSAMIAVADKRFLGFNEKGPGLMRHELNLGEPDANMNVDVLLVALLSWK